MDIVSLCALEPGQIEQVEQLVEQCRRSDRLRRSVRLDCGSLNSYPQMKRFFLLYEYGGLASFLMLLAPEADAAEAMAFTRPDCRRRGYFTALLDEAFGELRRFGVASLFFIHEPGSVDARKALLKLGAAMEHVEYLLSYEPRQWSVRCDVMRLQRAASGDIDALVALNAQVFETDRAVSESMILKCMDSDAVECYVARIAGEIVGMLCVGIEDDGAVVFGVGIAPDQQGRGYGKDMMALAIKGLTDRGVKEIVLEASSKNERALRLYRSCGFVVRAQLDYYRIPV